MAATPASDIDIKIGSIIRARREARGITQAQLGQAVGVTFQQIQKYERGANRVSAATMLKIADALTCHVADLYGDPDPEAASMSERAILRLWQDLTEGQRDATVNMIREFLKT